MKKGTLAVITALVAALLLTSNIRADEGKTTMDEKTSVVLINPFTVPVGKVDEAIKAWEAGRDFLSQQPGYISTKLHQSLTVDAQYQLINVAEWESPEAFRAATSAMRENGKFPPVEGVVVGPALYHVIRE
ncbi:MAG: antibiotic biosynthesis monooxygenase family protein [Pseudomonadota bacterium]